MLSAAGNIPQPPTSFSTYNKTTGLAVADVGESSMMQAAREAVAGNEEDDPSHITACFDGTWQKLGHTSLSGIISATSVDRRKVLDVEIMSKFCFVCHTNPTSQNEFKRNHEGISGGMEGAGVLNIFNRSLHTRGIGYIKYLGDGTAKHTIRWLQGSDMILT
jgi:hypothetical protein